MLNTQENYIGGSFSRKSRDLYCISVWRCSAEYLGHDFSGMTMLSAMYHRCLVLSFGNSKSCRSFWEGCYGGSLVISLEVYGKENGGRISFNISSNSRQGGDSGFDSCSSMIFVTYLKYCVCFSEYAVPTTLVSRAWLWSLAHSGSETQRHCIENMYFFWVQGPTILMGCLSHIIGVYGSVLGHDLLGICPWLLWASWI